MSPATCRCWSTASRAISRCMISVEPSKMRLMRMSRSACSAGTGFSPRARQDSAVSYPRPPRPRLPPASAQGLRGFIPAPAAHLDQLVEHLPAQLGAVELGDRRLDADVAL